MFHVLFSFSDFLYRHNVTFDNVTTEVEILDTSKCAVSSNFFLITFQINCDCKKFSEIIQKKKTITTFRDD